MDMAPVPPSGPREYNMDATCSEQWLFLGNGIMGNFIFFLLVISSDMRQKLKNLGTIVVKTLLSLQNSISLSLTL